MTSFCSDEHWQSLQTSLAALVDEEGERNRAASAPPPQGIPGLQGLQDRSQTPIDNWSDIRCDDEYESFYHAGTAAGRRLPPPLDAGAMYSQMHNPLQQSLLATRASPGLETINEQRPSSLPPQIMQVLNAMQERGASPAPPGLEYSAPLQQVDSAVAGNDQAMLQLLQAANQLNLSGRAPTPMATGSTPGPSVTPPPMPVPTPPPQQDHQAMAANAAAYAASMAAGQPQFNTVYSAAYQAALAQQQATTQNILLQQGQGHMAPQLAGQFAPQQSQVAAQIAASMAMNPSFMGTQNISAAAAAAAAAAVQNMMGGGVYDYDRNNDRDDRRPRGGRDRRRDRRGDLDRDRDRDDDNAPNARFQSLDEVIGQVLAVAKDQNGCRFLQRKFDEGGATAIATVFPEILDNLIELMTDPFGNYLTQKLLDRCSEEQRLEVLKRASEDQALVEVALNTHGTRAVQKLIETLSNAEQVSLVIKALEPGVVSLIRDLNGNHVIQRCLQRLGPEESQFVYNAALQKTMEIATHRHGCCVLQRCIDFATPVQKTELVQKVVDNAYTLSQDGFGNYCLQYVLELEQTDTNKQILAKLEGHFPELSQQKFSSNVVEKCLKLKGTYQEMKETIVKEIVESPMLARLLQDPYANFVIQTALAESSGDLHQNLVDAIRPFLPSLRGTPFGKRILAKINVKL